MLKSSTENAEGAQIVLEHWLIAESHERPESGGCRVELRDLVPVNNLPEAGVCRVIRDAFEHDLRCATEQGSVRDVSVSCNPPTVRGAPVDIPWLVVKDGLEGGSSVDHVAAGGVKHALGSAGAAACVEHEERILSVHPLNLALL